MNIAEFKKLPILGIIRGINLSQLEPLVNCIMSSGLRFIEFTMNTKDAAVIIQKSAEISKNKLTIGAGTVLSMQDLKIALKSGASFIVSPCLIEDVARYCRKQKIPYFPGALTPSEIYKSWQQGATMIKVFPAKCFGPGYFKEIKGPFNEIQLLACGGINKDTIGQYFANGASAASFGSSIFKKDLLEKGDYGAIQSSIEELIAAYKAL